MKKLLIIFKPTSIAILSLLAVSMFLRYYLYLNSTQLVREFKNQNYREIYSLDTMKISSRLNSLSSAINWVCIEGKISNKTFYKIKQGKCRTSILQQNQTIYLPHANNLEINFTSRLPKEVEFLFMLFFVFQSVLIFALIISTKKVEEEKRIHEIKFNKLARQMSHDIRSPLATLNTILDDGALMLTSESHRLLKKSLLRINEISNKYLDLSQPNSLTQSIPKMVEANLADDLLAIIELKKIEFKEIEMLINISEDNPIYVSLIDKIEFGRIISNIINNAAEASATQVHISLARSNQYISIIIKDNGNGIPLSTLKKLGSLEMTTKSSGNGLGIVHAKESIENWGGSIGIKSVINQFTEFSIILPSLDKMNVPKNEILNILLDDDELVRLTWQFKAIKSKINFRSYAKYEDLEITLDNLSRESNIYLDSELGDNVKGEDIAIKLQSLGFQNIFITSGNPKEHFKNLIFIKDIRDKTPPW